MSVRLRCAVYTRKSNEEGLEQSFNSLDAQRESCEAYVLSQAGEGWDCLPDLYDDGGWSGGNMERPALKRLLADIAKGRVDVVVVYKVDRLTRSLMDFARIVEVFDASKVSFVSVTQAFNTTSSMGRLTLNVLLSFAQFERDVTGERIRDKIAASKARGMWMGGNIPLGYDLGERQLIINAAEAETVRHINRRYLELKSLPALAKDLVRAEISTKRWVSRAGITHGGIPFNCSGLSHILKNRLYLGDVLHRGKAHRGNHPAIVDNALFSAVQAQLAANHHRHTTRKTRAAACPLVNKVFDANGQPMRPSFSYGRGKQMYRYYVSECLLPQGKIGHAGNQQGRRLPAERTERLLITRLSSLWPTEPAPDAVFEAICKVVAGEAQLRVSLDASRLSTGSFDEAMLLARARQQIDTAAQLKDGEVTFTFDIPALRKGRTVKLDLDGRNTKAIRESGAEVVRTSHRNLTELNASPLDVKGHANMRASADARIRNRLAVGLLAPDIQKALLQGTALTSLDLERLFARDLPLDWNEQRRLLKIFA